MLVTILAVTKAWDEFCIAGMNERGKWIRPISTGGSKRFWRREQLIREGEFIRCGDVWELNGYTPAVFQFSSHSEDFVATNLIYKKTLSNDQFLAYLRNNVEDEGAFQATVNAQQRSLCLLKPDDVYTEVNYWGDRAKPKMRFTGSFNLNNPKTTNGDYIVKDCKWSGLMLANHRVPRFREIYLCIGLATPAPYNNVEYPQIIGLHTNPLIPYPSEYPD